MNQFYIKIADIEWLPKEELKKIFTALQLEGECKLVGGCVRNAVANLGETDIDIATTHVPEKVMELLTENGVHCLPTGIKYGTVTAIINDKSFEITTLRQDEETDGRHAKVVFTDKWAEDAFRRDFTINAMYMGLNGEVTDYFAGKEDLQNKLIKFVGNAEKRIQEDYLRILRYFRFIGYLGVDNIEEKSFQACKKYSLKILGLSAERIRNEMLKIFSSNHLKEVLKLMIKANILELYGLNIKYQEIQDYKFCNETVVNLASVILLRKDKLADINAAWKLSNNMQKTLQLLIKEVAEINLRKSKELMYRYGKANTILICKLAKVLQLQIENDIEQLIENYTIPLLPINGNDLLAMGYKGKELGEKLAELEAQWINSDYSLDKKGLLY